MERFGKIATTGATAVLAAPVSYVAQRAFSAWGILDPFADAIGQRLKITMTGDQAAWTAALLLILALYGIALRIIWRKRAPYLGGEKDVSKEISAPTVSQAHYGTGHNVIGETVQIGGPGNG